LHLVFLTLRHCFPVTIAVGDHSLSEVNFVFSEVAKTSLLAELILSSNPVNTG
jgi:hypothetical protein